MANPYLYLTLLGLIIKIWAAHRIHQQKAVTGARLCLLFLLVCYSQTVLELYGYYLLTQPTPDAAMLLKLYYASVFTFILLLPVVFNALITGRVGWLTGSSSFAGWALVVCLLQTDLVIAGAMPLRYAITRVPGVYYGVFPLSCLTLLGITGYVLHCNYTRAATEIARVKSANFMIGFVPIFTGLAIIVTAMRLGAPITAAGFLPLLLCIQIYFIVENLKDNHIRDWRVFIPWTKRSKLVRQVLKPFLEVDISPNRARDLPEQYNQSLLDLAEDMFQQHAGAAKWLGIGRSTYYRKKSKDKTSQF